ncbi:MAG: efflux RND transporter periplasmic adaptor subunit [Janthinobacterium lividum]
MNRFFPWFSYSLPKRRIRPAAVALTLLALFTLAACHRQAPAADAPQLVLALPVHAVAGSLPGDTIHYPVEVAPRYSTLMSFRVAGKLIERDVRLGNTVKKGQVIARLDPADAQKQAASAQAVLDAARHRLVYAKQQLERDQAQAVQNLIAANQLEQTQDAYSAALANRQQAEAQATVAANTLQYNTLIVDHDGVITSENADTGQVLSAGQAVYGLAWSGDTDVTLDAAESDLARIHLGQAVNVTFPALPGRRFDARVREIAPAADPQSRTYRVRLTLLQPGDDVRLGMTGDAALLPGATSAPATNAAAAGTASQAAVATAADASHSGSTATATTGGGASSAAAGPIFTLPATALFHQGSRPAVWIVRPADSTLELRPVTVDAYSERATTVTHGLNDGDMVVLAGVHTVFAGQHVKPVAPLFTGEGDIDGPAPASAAATEAAQ